LILPPHEVNTSFWLIFGYFLQAFTDFLFDEYQCDFVSCASASAEQVHANPMDVVGMSGESQE